jgi:hypothetical protein
MESHGGAEVDGVDRGVGKHVIEARKTLLRLYTIKRFLGRITSHHRPHIRRVGLEPISG